MPTVATALPRESFAVESAVNELAQVLGMDPTVLREKNLVREGQIMPAYYGETAKSCALDRCLARAKEMIGWDEKYPYRDMENGKVRGVGVAMAMQGSGISGVDTGSVAIKVNDDGFYSLMIGATDMGTGCDTILSQVAAECLDCDMKDIIVHGVDTDISPYDCGLLCFQHNICDRNGSGPHLRDSDQENVRERSRVSRMFCKRCGI